MSKLTNPEEVLRTVVWYGAHRYDDKPSQFWNRMRIAAETLGDTEAASTFDDYCENGCPITNKHAQAAHILDALRKPSEGVLTAVVGSIAIPGFHLVVQGVLQAAIAAAEQEVGHG